MCKSFYEEIINDLIFWENGNEVDFTLAKECNLSFNNEIPLFEVSLNVKLLIKTLCDRLEKSYNSDPDSFVKFTEKDYQEYLSQRSHLEPKRENFIYISRISQEIYPASKDINYNEYKEKISRKLAIMQTKLTIYHFIKFLKAKFNDSFEELFEEAKIFSERAYLFDNNEIWPGYEQREITRLGHLDQDIFFYQDKVFNLLPLREINKRVLKNTNIKIKERISPTQIPFKLTLKKTSNETKILMAEFYELFKDIAKKMSIEIKKNKLTIDTDGVVKIFRSNNELFEEIIVIIENHILTNNNFSWGITYFPDNKEEKIVRFFLYLKDELIKLTEFKASTITFCFLRVIFFGYESNNDETFIKYIKQGKNLLKNK